MRSPQLLVLIPTFGIDPGFGIKKGKLLLPFCDPAGILIKF